MARCAVFLVAFAENDLEVLVPTGEVLKTFSIVGEPTLLGGASGETPDFAEFAAEATRRGVRIVIAAVQDRRLARALAAALAVPLIRVPVPLNGSPAAALSSLLDDDGDPASEAPEECNQGAYATVALGAAGAKNAALLAVSILALSDSRLRDAWQAFRAEQTQAVLSQPPPSG